MIIFHFLLWILVHALHYWFALRDNPNTLVAQGDVVSFFVIPILLSVVVGRLYSAQFKTQHVRVRISFFLAFLLAFLHAFIFVIVYMVSGLHSGWNQLLFQISFLFFIDFIPLIFIFFISFFVQSRIKQV